FILFFSLIASLLAGLPFVIFTITGVRYHHEEVTISYDFLGGVMIPVTILTMIIGECLLVYLKRIKSKSSFGSYVASVYKAVGTFLFGAAMNQSLTSIAKYNIKPDLVDVCKPEWRLGNCSLNYDACTEDEPLSNEGRLSFYSGHSSLSMYCMLFLAVSTCNGYILIAPSHAQIFSPHAHILCLHLNVFCFLSKCLLELKNHMPVLTFLLLVVFVSDFFKPCVDPRKEADIPHTSLQETPTNGKSKLS
uniref:Phospholipid phosphatase 1a n=1 Tax=Sparus aurata TaxID=8175 RepID=A0A671V3B6_SPAAU